MKSEEVGGKGTTLKTWMVRLLCVQVPRMLFWIVLPHCSLPGLFVGPCAPWVKEFLSRQLDCGSVHSLTSRAFWDTSSSEHSRQQGPTPIKVVLRLQWDDTISSFGVGGERQNHMTRSFPGVHNSQAPGTWISPLSKTICFQHLLVVLFLQETATDLWSAKILHMGMVADTCNPSTWGLRQENWKFEASLGAKAKLCLKKLFRTFTLTDLIFLAIRWF